MTDNSLGQRVHRAAVVGALAGLSAAVLDLASTVLWLTDSTDRLRLALAVTALCVGASTLVAVGIVLVLSANSQGILGRSQRLRWLLGASLLSLGPAIALGTWLFEGGRMRRLAGLVWLRPLAMLSLFVLQIALYFTLHRVLGWLRVGASVRAQRVVAALAVLAAMTLHAIDHRVLPRLYEYLHTVVGALTVLSLAIAWHAVIHTPSRAVSRVCLLAALPWLLVAQSALGRWDNVRAEVFATHAPVARHVAIVLQFFTPNARLSQASSALVAARLSAQRAAQTNRTTRDARLAQTLGAHVLLLSIDALRDDFVTHQRTPAMASLAREGVRFRRTYAQAPHSSYSISTLHTGVYLHERVAAGLSADAKTLAEQFAHAGYRTVGLYTDGIFFTEGESLRALRDRHLGFSRFDHSTRDAEATTDLALAELAESVRLGEPPTLLWAHYFDAHEPYRGDGTTQRERYESAVAKVDRAIARLLSHARRTLTRPLIIALTADHGEEFGEHGGVYHGSTLFEEQVRVPLIIVSPAISQGEVTSPVGLVDLAPTLLALAGIAHPSASHGRDLRPWMQRETSPPDEAATEPVFAAVNTRVMALVYPYKLVADLRWGVRELYQLDRDPHERTNLADQEPQRVLALEAELRAWLARVAEGAASDEELRARMGDHTVTPALASRVSDPRLSRDERERSVEALGALHEVTTIEQLFRQNRDGALARSLALALAREGSALGRPLVHLALQSDEPAVRSRAALALAVYGDPLAIDALGELLSHGDEPERHAAIAGLALSGPSAQSERALLAALEDDHLRFRAAMALGQVSGLRSFARLLDLARHDRAADVRAWAVAAMAPMTPDPRVRDAVIERMRNDVDAQTFAASVLARWGDRATDVRVWDAREGSGVCARSEDNAPWIALGARACELSPLRTARIPSRAVNPTAARRWQVWLRATGDTAVSVHVGEGAGAREVLRFALEGTMHEWRATIEGADIAHAAIEVRVAERGHARVAHLVMLAAE